MTNVSITMGKGLLGPLSIFRPSLHGPRPRILTMARESRSPLITCLLKLRLVVPLPSCRFTDDNYPRHRGANNLGPASIVFCNAERNWLAVFEPLPIGVLL